MGFDTNFKAQIFDLTNLNEAKNGVNDIVQQIKEIQGKEDLSNEAKQTAYTNYLLTIPDSNQYKSIAQDFDILSGSVDKFTEDSLVNLYAGQIKNTQGFVGVKSAIKTYNTALQESPQKAKLVAKAIGQTNVQLGNHLTKLDGAEAGVIKYGASLVGVTVKTIGLQVATTALNAAISFGVSLAIQSLITLFDELYVSSEEVAQAAEELKNNFDETTTTINDNLKSIEGFSEEFKKLSKGVDENGNNIALTTSEYSRYKEIVEQLVDMNPTLLKGYNSEYEAIINKNGAIEQTIELLKEQRKQELKDLTTDKNLKKLGKSAVQDMKDYMTENPLPYGDAKYNFEQAFEKATNYYDTKDDTTWTQGSNNIRDIYNALNPDNINTNDFWTEGYWSKYGDNSSAFAQDFYEQIVEDLRNNEGILKDYFTNQDVQDLLSIADKYDENVHNYNHKIDEYSKSLNSTLQYVAQAHDSYEQLTDAQRNLVSSYINTFRITEKTTQDDIIKMKDNIQDTVESMPDDIALNMGLDLAFKIDFSTDTVEEYKQKIEEAIDYIINSDFNKDEEGNPIYEGEEGKNQIKLMLGFAVETNEGEIKDKVEDTKDKVKNKLSGVFNLSDKELESKLKIPIEQLQALAEVDLSDLSQFKSFEELMEYIQTMNGKKPFEFISSEWTEDVDKAVDKANKITSLIEKINNGEASQADIWDTLKDFDEFPDLLPYIHDTEALKKKLVEISQVEQNDLIAQLESLKARLTDPEQIKGCEALISLLRELDVLSGGKSKETYINDYLEYQQDKIEDIVDNLEEEKEAQEDILDNLESQKEELEEQKQLIEDIIEDYETAASTVTTVLEDKIQELTDQKDELEQAYEDQIANIEERYNTEIEALQEKNDEINRSIELKKKEDELYNAKRTRVRVYSESGGWTEQTDSQAVKEKTQELQSLQRQYAIEDLENQRDKEIKALEDKKENDPRLKKYAEEIEAYEKYMEAFEKMVESYEREQNDLTAARILGVNWHEQVLNRDTGLIQTYGQNYTSYQKQLYEDIEKEIEAKDLAIAKQQEVIDSRDKEIEHWNNFSKDLQKVTDEITNANEDYFLGLDNVLVNEQMSYQNRVNALAQFKKDMARLNELGDNPTMEQVEGALGHLRTVDGSNIEDNKEEKKYKVYYITPDNKEHELSAFSKMSDATKFKEAHVDLLMKQCQPDSQYLKEKFNLNLDKNTPNSVFRQALNSKIRIKQYADGGSVDYTGFAMVHGTNQKAETMFNARDSKKLYELVHKTSDLSSLIANNINANLLKAFNNIKTIKAVNPDTNLAFNFYGATIQADNYESFERCMNTYLSQARMNNWVGK